MKNIPVSENNFIQLNLTKARMMETMKSVDWNTVIEFLHISYLQKMQRKIPHRLAEKYSSFMKNIKCEVCNAEKTFFWVNVNTYLCNNCATKKLNVFGDWK